uniref:Secreted protein n=1 Tax=Knipowitschia caucasica TaxID=637954 RepID=A0AAV2J4N6_KNICA
MDRVVLMKLSVIFQQQLLCLQSAESECLKAKERRIRQYAAARRRRLRRVMLMQRQINTVFLARMGTMSSKRSVWVRQKSDAWWRQVATTPTADYG